MFTYLNILWQMRTAQLLSPHSEGDFLIKVENKIVTVPVLCRLPRYNFTVFVTLLWAVSQMNSMINIELFVVNNYQDEGWTWKLNKLELILVTKLQFVIEGKFWDFSVFRFLNSSAFHPQIDNPSNPAARQIPVIVNKN